MAKTFLSAPSLLKENIFFLIAGTCLASICILLFDERLYTIREVLTLFTTVLLLFFLQAFAGGSRTLISNRIAAIQYVQSLLTTLLGFCLLYAFLLPFSFDFVRTFNYSLLVSFVHASLYFFMRYQKAYAQTVEQKRLIAQTAKQQQVKELEVLKQQIDPHFIFNSFNTLGFLIDENSEKAKRFSNKLANVYRYIIFNSNKNLVALADELGFAKDYAYLQEIRHSDEVQIQFSVPTDTENVFVLPVSLQLLIENAIKHNEFTEGKPLCIAVGYGPEGLSVENNVSAKNYNIPSSKIGLSNLRNRCRLILGKDLSIVKTEDAFKVVLPVLHK